MMKEKLDDFLKKALVNYDLPGLAVGIRVGEAGGNDGLVYRNAEGYKDYISKEPLLPEHIFHMASVTKLFCGNFHPAALGEGPD